MNDDTRPDPDALLAQVQAEEAHAHRGRLKIFFGANAGVGKTYAMLAAARQALVQGRAVRVGVVETHGRTDTEAMARELPRLPLREITHRGQRLREFDLDAALAFEQTHPDGVVLVDELAHSNAPGSRHPKRWQDVDELLQRGVDVWTTLNVQHLESLNDIVGGITGIRVTETVPDRVFDEADEVVIVDIPPDELLARLKAGKVYLPRGDDNPAERAAQHFFRKGNLLALRELALRRTADRVDEQMLAYRRSSKVDAVWPNREALLACVGAGPQGEKVVRSAARLAAQLDVAWHAVHVQTGRLLSDAQRQQVLRLLKLAQDLGATTATLSAAEPAEALLRYARDHNLVRLVVGRSERPISQLLRLRRPLAQKLSQAADDIDVLQVALPEGVRPLQQEGAPAINASIPWQRHIAAAAAIAATTLLAWPLHDVLELTNIVMLFLLAVVGIALGLGRGPALLAAFLGVGAFDFFFVPPQWTFAVSDAQYLVTFAVMLVVALVIGQLTAGLKAQAQAAAERERRQRGLYAMARDLGGVLLPEQVAEIGQRFLLDEFGVRSALLALDEHDKLQQLPGAAVAPDLDVARWAFDQAKPAGAGTDTLPSSPCLMLPLKAPMRVRGVLALEVPAVGAMAKGWTPEDRQLLDTCASLLAISLERLHYVEVARSSTVQIESERLRNTLLAAISHDLRTPLTGLVGLADTLQLLQPTAAQADLIEALRESAQRMAAMVEKLLDLARLQSGAVPLQREPHALEDLIGAARRQLGARLAAHPIVLESPLPEGLVDGPLFERLIVNLLENAAKHTPAGTRITVRAGVAEGQLRLVVDDDGPGLPKAVRGREQVLFDKFERGQRESNTPGVGLGLALCKAIAEAHGGRIEATSRPEGGARFTVTLPS